MNNWMDEWMEKSRTFHGGCAQCWFWEFHFVRTLCAANYWISCNGYEKRDWQFDKIKQHEFTDLDQANIMRLANVCVCIFIPSKQFYQTPCKRIAVKCFGSMKCFTLVIVSILGAICAECVWLTMPPYECSLTFLFCSFFFSLSLFGLYLSLSLSRSQSNVSIF